MAGKSPRCAGWCGNGLSDESGGELAASVDIGEGLLLSDSWSSEGDLLYRAFGRKEGAEKLVVERVSGLVGFERAEDGVVAHVDVAAGVKELVAGALVRIPETLGVDYMGVIHDNCVVKGAAEGEVMGVHVLDIPHEAEGARAGNLSDEVVAGEVKVNGLAVVGNCRMVELNPEIHGEPALRGGELGPFAALSLDPDGLLYLVEDLRRIEVDDACGVQQVDKRIGAAVHDGDLGSVDIDVEVVDSEGGKRSLEVLDGRDPDAVLVDESGAELCVADDICGNLNRDRLGKINPRIYKACVSRSRTERDGYSLP